MINPHMWYWHLYQNQPIYVYQIDDDFQKAWYVRMEPDEEDPHFYWGDCEFKELAEIWWMHLTDIQAYAREHQENEEAA